LDSWTVEWLEEVVILDAEEISKAKQGKKAVLVDSLSKRLR